MPDYITSTAIEDLEDKNGCCWSGYLIILRDVALSNTPTSPSYDSLASINSKPRNRMPTLASSSCRLLCALK
eukprot:5070313-Amphidinium_carterae.1